MNGTFCHERIARLYEKAPCGFLISTRDGVILGANRTFLSWTEQDEQDIVGRNVRELLSPASKLFYDTHYVALLQIDRVNGLAMELARGNAPALPVLVTSKLEHDAAAPAPYVHSTFFDASERRDSERALVAAKRRADSLADVVHSSPNAVLTADFDLQTRTWNAAAGSIWKDRAVWSARLDLYQWLRETLDKESKMARGKRYQPEQVVNLLRQIEVAVANGKTTGQACKEAEIVEQTYFRWRKEYGGLQIDQAKRLKELEQENSKLKRLVANLSLDNLVLKDIASGNF